MKTKNIRQTITFNASPHEIYETLMDSRKHAKFTGAKAHVSRKVGGMFTAYNRGLTGTNIELVRDKKIVQSWHASMKGWSKNHYSKVTFSLKKVKGGTRLNFKQSRVPVQCYNMIKQGWHDYYWKRMKEMLKK